MKENKSLWPQFLEELDKRDLKVPNPRRGKPGVHQDKITALYYIDLLSEANKNPKEDKIIGPLYESFKKHSNKKLVISALKKRKQKREHIRTTLRHLSDPDLSDRVVKSLASKGKIKDVKEAKRVLDQLIKDKKKGLVENLKALSPRK